MASAIIAEALLLSDTGLYDLEKNSPGFFKEGIKNDTLTKSEF